MNNFRRIRGSRLKVVLVVGILTAVLAVAAACVQQNPLEFRISGDNLEWRYEGDDAWNVAAATSELGGGDTSAITAQVTSLSSTISGLQSDLNALESQVSGLMSQVGDLSTGDGATPVLAIRGGGFVEFLSAGTVIQVSGTGFEAGETVRLTGNGNLLASATANSSGAVNFGEEISIPSSVQPSGDGPTDAIPVALVATGASSGLIAISVVTVEDKLFN